MQGYAGHMSAMQHQYKLYVQFLAFPVEKSVTIRFHSKEQQ